MFVCGYLSSNVMYIFVFVYSRNDNIKEPVCLMSELF